MRRIPPEQRREELVAAAIRVISRGGVSAATTRAIVAEADMPLGAFSYIFGTQDELMRAVVDTVTEQERFAAELAAMSAPSIEAAVRSGIHSYLDALEADPERELVLWELALFSQRHGPEGRAREQWATYYRTAEALLTYAGDLTEMEWDAPLQDLGRLLITMLDGLTTTWLADRDSAAARRSADFIAEAFAAHARPKGPSTPARITDTRPASTGTP